MFEREEQTLDERRSLTRRDLALLGVAGLFATALGTLNPASSHVREAEPGDDRGGHGNDDGPGDDHGGHRADDGPGDDHGRRRKGRRRRRR